MKTICATFVLWLCCLLSPSVYAQAIPGCDEFVDPQTGDIRNYCIPEDWNGDLVIWAHGFQDATDEVSIPVGQLIFGDTSIPDIVNSLGFAFATNSYRKTGLAIKQGQQDILDMVEQFESVYGKPNKIYLTGASEGGIITTLLIEKHPDIFNGGGLAACGPIGDFQAQLNYFGDGRALFEVFFPGVIPGDPFAPSEQLVNDWGNFYETNVKPLILAPENAEKFEAWVRMSNMPFDENDFTNTAEESAEDVLRYAVVNLNDAVDTLGGFPFDNQDRVYSGSGSPLIDFIANVQVQRVSVEPQVTQELQEHYTTSGVIHRPLVTLHTTLDQQVPVWHETLYSLKHLPKVSSGESTFQRVNLIIDRFGHCNFTSQEALFAFLLLFLQ